MMRTTKMRTTKKMTTMVRNKTYGYLFQIPCLIRKTDGMLSCRVGTHGRPDVYLPLVNDYGVDCVIKKEDGTFGKRLVLTN